jgi:hypothetical protein
MNAFIRAAAAAVALLAAGCQTTETSFDNEVFSDETRALDQQLQKEAAMVGATQGAIGMAAAWDPTGAASLATIPAGLAVRQAHRASADARMNAQLKRDEEALYKRWGMNPDGTPSGVRPGSHAVP